MCQRCRRSAGMLRVRFRYTSRIRSHIMYPEYRYRYRYTCKIYPSIYHSMATRTAIELLFIALVEPPRDRRPGAVCGGDGPRGLSLDTPEALVGSCSLVAVLLHFFLDDLSAEQECGLAGSLAPWMGLRSWAWCLVCARARVCVCVCV